MSVTKEQFRSRNGCTLAEVSWRVDTAHAGLKAAIEKLAEAEGRIRPLRNAADEAWSVKENAECLRTIWWQEYEEAVKAGKIQKSPNSVLGQTPGDPKELK